MSSHLISKLPTYLVRLQLTYQNAGERRLSEIILHCHYTTIADAAYDNLDGGMYGHDVVLFLPIETLSLVGLDELEEVRKRLLADLNTLGEGVDNEWFNALRLSRKRRVGPVNERPLRSIGTRRSDVWVWGTAAQGASIILDHSSKLGERLDGRSWRNRSLLTLNSTYIVITSWFAIVSLPSRCFSYSTPCLSSGNNGGTAMT